MVMPKRFGAQCTGHSVFFANVDTLVVREGHRGDAAEILSFGACPRGWSKVRVMFVRKVARLGRARFGRPFRSGGSQTYAIGLHDSRKALPVSDVVN
jgi:hypothetical protein